MITPPFSKLDPKGKIPIDDWSPKRDIKGKTPVEDGCSKFSSSNATTKKRVNHAQMDYECISSEEETPLFLRNHGSFSPPSPPEIESSSEDEDINDHSSDQADQEGSIAQDNSSSEDEGDGIQKIYLPSAYIANDVDPDFYTLVTQGNWDEINDHLINNVPFITSLKLEFLLPDALVRKLQDSIISYNTTLGHVLWHRDQPYCNICEQIELHLINNNKNFKYHPNDFVHGRLSKHAYKDSNVTDSVTLGDPHLKDWKITKVFNYIRSTSYYAIIYQNDTTHQMVLAVRGTKTGAIEELKGLFKKSGYVKNNIEEILGGTIVVGQQKKHFKVTQYAVEKADKNKYRLSFTGHSLGAWLAELSVFYCRTYFNHYNIDIKAVTFDSPGTKPMMKKLQSNIINDATHVDLKKLPIITYLASPNPVNCCNPHVGRVMQVEVDMPKTDHFEEKASKRVKKAIGDKAYGLLAIEGHHLSNILASFDPITGQSEDCKEMADWPTMKYRGTKTFASNGSDLIQLGIDELFKLAEIETPLVATIAAKAAGKVADWIIGDTTLMTMIGFLKSIITGEVDQEQYWAYFEHINKKNSSIHNFALCGKAKYRINRNIGSYIMNPTKGSTDEYLYNLYFKYRLNFNDHHDSPITEQLKVLLSTFTIKEHNNGQYYLIANNGHTHENIRQCAKRILQVTYKPLLKPQKIYFVYKKTSKKHADSKQTKYLQNQDSPVHKKGIFQKSSSPQPQDSQILNKQFAKNPNEINDDTLSQSLQEEIDQHLQSLSQFLEEEIDQNLPTSNTAAFSIPLPPQPPSSFQPQDSQIPSTSSPTPIAKPQTSVKTSSINLQPPILKAVAKAVPVAAPNNQLTIYKIKNLQELKKLQTLFGDKSSVNTLAQISQLDLSEFTITQHTIDAFNTLFTTIAQNNDLISNFSILIIGEMDEKIKVKFPKLSNLKKLTVKKIGKKSSLNLNGCNQLEDFSIDMNSKATLKLSKNFDKLRNLSITHIHNSTVTLPSNLDNLTSLTLGWIWTSAKVTLPKSLSTLKDLTFQNINDTDRIKWPQSLSTVESLTIGYVAPDDPDSLLKTLFFLAGAASLQKKPNFSFLNQLTGLTSLSIDSISDDTILEFPNIDCNLTTVSFGSIDKRVKMNSSKLFNKVTNLSINYIDDKVNFQLPNSFHKLETLSINSIWKNATFTLPNTLKHLKTFSIGSIEKNGTVKVPASYPQQTNFTVQTIWDHATLNLSGSIDSQTKTSMRTIWKQAITKSYRSSPKYDYDSSWTFDPPSEPY